MLLLFSTCWYSVFDWTELDNTLLGVRWINVLFDKDESDVSHPPVLELCLRARGQCRRLLAVHMGWDGEIASVDTSTGTQAQLYKAPLVGPIRSLLIPSSTFFIIILNCYIVNIFRVMTIPDEVDIIICGGGSSGCVPAGRLANLDHNLSVLLIEAGEDNLNNQWWECRGYQS